MKKLIIAFVFLGQLVAAQSKGTVTGLLTDGESNNEPLPFANVFIKGTTIGGTSDFDGKYSLKVDSGKHVLVFSFVGYKTVEKNIEIKAGETLTIDVTLSAKAGVTLDEVQIKATVNKAKLSALLLEQKQSISIKTTIGAEELENKGVSDLATAVTKTTGISKQEGSSNVFVRGLGDRYNSTTLNGLPLPSNNPSRKNITLDIFNTGIVQKIDVNKIYGGTIYGDFGGANVNIISKEHVGKPSLEIGIGSGTNSNLSGTGKFYLDDGPSLSGFYNLNYPSNPLASYNFNTSWDKHSAVPVGSSISFKGGRKYQIGEEGNLNLFATASFDSGFKFKEGIKRGSVNKQGLAFTDYDFKSYSYNTNTTGMLNLAYKANTNNKYKFSSLFINSSSQNLEEYNGIINVFDNAGNGGGYVRRSTFDRTSFFVNQFLGDHTIKENVLANWGISYNYVKNVVPDRKQNMLVPQDDNDPSGLKTVSDLASSDNHRFFQDLKENEIAVNTSVAYLFSKNKEEEYKGKITLGYSGRFKKVDFNATQFNFRINRKITQPIVSEDNLDAYFNQSSIDNDYFKIETFRGDAGVAQALIPQTYGGNQYVNAGFVEGQYQFSPKLTAVLGVRVEHLFQDIKWNTSLGEGKSDFAQFEILPSTSLKYQLTDKQNLKFAASKSYTLPQYKERAPFQFDEVGQIKFGNPDLTPSTNYNADIRWEYFPKRTEVISVTGFGKIIQNPINEVVVASATNDISYVNTGEQATVFGAEFEIRKDLFSFENEKSNDILTNKLSAGFNASYMYSNQDFDFLKVIKETKLNVNFTNTEGRLSGASDLILNADVTYFKEFSKEKNLLTTLSYNYFSDRVYAIGSAGKGDIVDRGLGTLDLIVKSQLAKRIKLGLSLKNLLNPTVKRVQEAQNVEVLSFKNGVNASLSLSYKLD